MESGGQSRSVLTAADHIYAKAYELYNATEWPLDTWGAVHLAARLWNSGELTDDHRRSLVGDLNPKGTHPHRNSRRVQHRRSYGGRPSRMGHVRDPARQLLTVPPSPPSSLPYSADQHSDRRLPAS